MTERQTTYFASIIAVCGTVAILVKEIYKGKKEMEKITGEEGMKVMKKYMLMVLSIICILGLAGCNKKSMNYIISNEPSITGNIKEVNENSILIENESGEYVVSLKVENSDGIYSPIMVGDKVAVYYDESIAESYPMQINTIYAILLQEPANRTVNEKP